jgi:hypothetical protein
MTKNALAEADAFELAADLADLASEDAGRGSENVTSNDISIPYISILQALSPQVQEGTPEFIMGAKAGHFFQNVNLYTYDGKTGVEVVPCAYDRKIIEWVPRDAGGGLVAVHDINTPLMQEARPNDKGVPTLPNGHNLIDTSTHYVLYKNPFGIWEPAVISMKSSAQKKSRLWNSLIAQQLIPGTDRPAPRWLFVWRLTTVLEQKDNNRWYNFEIAREVPVTKDVYLRAKAINEQFKRGALSAAGEAPDGDSIPF